MDKGTAETIVKVIGILGILGAILGVIGSLVVIFGGTALINILPSTTTGITGGVLSGAMIVVGIVVLLISIFAFIVALQLMKYRNWARIVYIIFAALGVLNGLITLPFGLLWIIIDGAILYFLAFDKDVVGLFKS